MRFLWFGKTVEQAKQEVPKLQEQEMVNQENEISVLKNGLRQFEYGFSEMDHAFHPNQGFLGSHAATALRDLETAQRQVLNARLYGKEVLRRAAKLEKDLIKIRDGDAQSKSDKKVTYFTDQEWQIIATAKRLDARTKDISEKIRDLIVKLQHVDKETKNVEQVGAQLGAEARQIKRALEKLVEEMEALLRLEKTAGQLMKQYSLLYEPTAPAKSH